MSLRRLFIVTGDASGDIHAAKVVAQLQQQYPHVEIQAIGGPALAATGITLFAHQTQTGVFGLGALAAIASHMALGQKLKAHIASWQPDAVLLVDYGAFNLWLAKQLQPQRQNGLKLFYYIPPQVWASRPWRTKTIRQNIDHVFTIFPFEAQCYIRYGVPFTYVGHPLVEQCVHQADRVAFCKHHDLDPTLPIIGLFPGSRRSEIKSLLPDMVQAIPLLNKRSQQPYQFLLVQSAALPQSFYMEQLAPYRAMLDDLPFKMLRGVNHEVLALSQAAWVASGTVTLEAALYRTPVVIAYRVSQVASWLFRLFMTVKSIGLPNLLSDHGKRFLPELLMHQVTPNALCEAILPYLSMTEERTHALEQFEHIRQVLGQQSASLRVVQELARLTVEPLVNSGEETTTAPA